MKIHAPRLILSLILGLVLTTAACATHSSETTDPGSQQDNAQPQSKEYEQVNFYYEFKDILIPKELSPVDDAKYVFDDDRFLAGFRVFKGRVVADDLAQFFLNNMKKDGWTKKFSLKAEKSVLVFQKPDKSCTILIENGFNTKVTVFAIDFKNRNVNSDVQVQDLPQ